MQKHSVFKLFLPLGIAFLTSCEKVLDIDLKDAEPRLIVEGNVSDQPGPYTVQLSQSVSFNAPNQFPAVSNALVIISDNAGQRDTLQETSPGNYQTNTLQGIPGRQYFLQVKVKDQVYEAVSQMQQPVAIQKVEIEKFRFNEAEKVTAVYYQDPAGISNYYRFLLFVNNVPSKNLYLNNDEFQDGQLVDDVLFDNDLKLKSGDSVLVLLRNLDQPVFKNFRAQNQLGNSQISSPANPESNISNGALGYFSAHPESSGSVVVP